MAPYAVLIGLGMAVHAWAASRWPANFDSDEAIFGLMSRHILLRGELPTYCYGQNYMGSLDALLAAISMRVFGTNVLALRAPQVVLFGLFLGLHGALVSRWWGRRVALMSMLVLALPGWQVLYYTHRLNVSPNLVLGLGTAALLLAFGSSARASPTSHARAAALGVSLGLGLWVNPLIVTYIVSIGTLALLRSPEWADLNAQLRATLGSRAWTVLSWLIGPVLIGALVLGFFCAGCEPSASLEVYRNLARSLLVALSVALVWALLRVTRRRRRLPAGAAALLAGLAIGNLPQWRAWLFDGVVPSVALMPSCPSEIPARARLVFGQILPVLWGLNPFDQMFRRVVVDTALCVAVLIIAVGAVVLFAHQQRRAWSRLVTAQPLTRSDLPGAAAALLLATPLALTLLGSNTADIYAVRYMLIAWQANSMILALFLCAAWARRRWLGLLLVAIWFSMAGIRNLVVVDRLWDADAKYAPEATQALADHLSRWGVRGGYSNYWTAYTLDFLFEEQVTIAPYYHERYPAYTEFVSSLPVHVYIFDPGDVSTGSSDLGTLVQAASADRVPGPAEPWILERLSRQVVLDRSRVANWDVWIVADP